MGNKQGKKSRDDSNTTKNNPGDGGTNTFSVLDSFINWNNPK